jgi:murein DD-endopeptidase MepM/ murein hydrolase activator NlpD
MPTSTPRRLSALLRTFLLVVTVAGAPAAIGAEPSASPGASAEASPEATDDPQTSVELAEEIARQKAEQEALAAALAEQQRQVAELQALQKELEGQIDQTATALEAVTANLVTVRQEITGQIERIEVVKARYAELVAELAALDEQLTDLVAREKVKAKELHERQALLAERMRVAYDADRTSVLELFLTGRSFSEMLAEVSYHLDVAEQDRMLAERIKADQEILLSLRESVEMARTQTNIVRQETAVQGKKLDAELVVLEKTKVTLAELEAKTAEELAFQQQQFEQLSSSKEDLEAAIANAERAQQEVSGSISRLVEAQAKLGHIPSEYNGAFIWPLEARISGEWGCSTYEGYGPGGPGCMHFHNGIDIVDECNTEIVAAGDGVVAYAGFNWADGADPAFIVVIAHTTELKTWYAHLQPVTAPGIVPGREVKEGEVIGYEGNTGHSSGCHLHWMVEMNGEFVNPREFL